MEGEGQNSDKREDQPYRSDEQVGFGGGGEDCGVLPVKIVKGYDWDEGEQKRTKEEQADGGGGEA